MKADHMGLETGTPRKSERVRKAKTFTDLLLLLSLVFVGYFSLSIPCSGQENQQVDESTARTASPENSPKPPVQDQQPTPPAQAKVESKKKKKHLGPGAFELSMIRRVHSRSSFTYGA